MIISRATIAKVAEAINNLVQFPEDEAVLAQAAIQSFMESEEIQNLLIAANNVLNLLGWDKKNYTLYDALAPFLTKEK